LDGEGAGGEEAFDECEVLGAAVEVGEGGGMAGKVMRVFCGSLCKEQWRVYNAEGEVVEDVASEKDVRHQGDRVCKSTLVVVEDRSDARFAYRRGAMLYRGDAVAQVKKGWIAEGSVFVDTAGRRLVVRGRKLVMMESGRTSPQEGASLAPVRDQHQEGASLAPLPSRDIDGEGARGGE
jgi:hypothetical protein